MLRLDRENNPDILRQAAQLLERENQRLIRINVELQRRLLEAEGRSPEQMQQKLLLLEEQLAQRNHALFGDSSEKRPRKKTDQDEHAPQRGHGRRKQPALPIVEQIHDLDEADKVCTSCGGQLAEWKEQFEESEEIDVIERRFIVKKHRRKKYRCGCQGCVDSAPGPVKLFPGARYSIDFAIDVMVGKYLDHLPLERQVRIMAREGLVVDSQTLWDYLERIARLLAPAYDRLHAYLLTLRVLGADETHWRLMGAKGQDAGIAKKWFVWALVAPEAVCYRIEDSRSTKAAQNVLQDFSSILVVDGYAVYERLSKIGDGFLLAFCWSHVRRKFVEAEPHAPKASEAIELINELFMIERLCPPGPDGDGLRHRLRQERSRPVVDKLRSWLNTQRVLPESSLGKAISYTLGLWPGLIRFLEDPQIPLHNNASERALRGVVVGRKNHYGSRSRRGTEVAAICYSLLESAKFAGIEPKAYLRVALGAAIEGREIPLPHELARAA